jgi:hypothetical protein
MAPTFLIRKKIKFRDLAYIEESAPKMVNHLLCGRTPILILQIILEIYYKR